MAAASRVVGVATALAALWLAVAQSPVSKHVVLFYKYPVLVDLNMAKKTVLVTPPDITNIGKSQTFYDYKTRMIAYKDLKSSQCYLEPMKHQGLQQQLHQLFNNASFRMKAPPRTLYVSDVNLNKYEVWKLAGAQIGRFCRGYPASLLQEFRPRYLAADNELPEEEGDATNDDGDDPFLPQRQHGRAKRQVARTSPRRFKGQTQTQYVAFQNGGTGTNNGRAEAESRPDLSRAHVSGSHGMGQAQSQTGADDCDGCYYPGATGGVAPGQLRPPPYGPGAGRPGILGQPGATGGPGESGGLPGMPTHYPGQQRPGGPGYPGQPGMIGGPGSGAGVGGFPGQVPGQGPGAQTGLPGYPGQRPGTPVDGRYPMVVPVYPGQIPGSPGYPGQVPGAGGVVGPPGLVHYPGQVPGAGGYPGQVPGAGGIPGQVPGAGGYPGQVPGAGGYPGQVPGAGGIPGQVPGAGGYPGQVPGAGGIPGKVPGAGGYPGQVLGQGGYPGQVPGQGGYPGQVPGAGGIPGKVPGAGGYPGQIPGAGGIPGQVPGVAGYPGQVPGAGGYPGQVPGAGGYPGQVPGAGGYPGQVPGAGGIPGQVPGVGGIPGQVPGAGGYPGQVPGAGGINGQVPGAGGIPGQVPGAGGYPGQIPGAGGITGQVPSAGGYPGQVPGGGGIPGQVPGTGGYPGQVPGAGGYPGQLPGAGGYPGQVPGAGGYPGQVPGAGGYPGQVPGAGGIPGHVPGEGGAVGPQGQVHYPGQSPGAGGYPGQVPGAGAYPGQVPSAGGVVGPPGQVHYPGLSPGAGGYPGKVPGTGGYPGQVPGAGGYPGQVPGAGGYPGQVPAAGGYPGQVPGAGGIPGQVPGVGGYPGQVPGGGGIPGQVPGAGGIPGQVPGVGGYPGQIAGAGGYPGQIPGVGGYPGQVPGVGGYPGQVPGAGGYPGQVPGAGGYPGQVPGAGGYPGQVPGTGGYPGQVPGTGGYPGQVPGAGGYPGPVPGAGGYPGQAPGTGTPGYPGQIPSAGGAPGYPGQIPGVPGLVPGGLIAPPGYPGQVVGGCVIQGGVCMPGTSSGAREGDSQTQTSVHHTSNGTRATASSQGKIGEGVAQTQVSGLYSGSGSFSAQAHTADRDRSAQSQVIGNDQGSTSNAQGQAGTGMTQSQVQFGSDDGATMAEAQSDGWNHGTNTQVQAGSQGGMADAQANGPGSTSSQAQIGFKPYKRNGSNGQTIPFQGGGTASSQSGAYSGKSQTQVQGSFRHGISYTGAAQAGSGNHNGRTNRQPTPLSSPTGGNGLSRNSRTASSFRNNFSGFNTDDVNDIHSTTDKNEDEGVTDEPLSQFKPNGNKNSAKNNGLDTGLGEVGEGQNRLDGAYDSNYLVSSRQNGYHGQQQENEDDGKEDSKLGSRQNVYDSLQPVAHNAGPDSEIDEGEYSQPSQTQYNQNPSEVEHGPLISGSEGSPNQFESTGTRESITQPPTSVNEYDQYDDSEYEDVTEHEEKPITEHNNHMAQLGNAEVEVRPSSISTRHGTVTFNGDGSNVVKAGQPDGPSQTQLTHVGPLGNHDAHVIQDSDNGQHRVSAGDVLQPGQHVAGYTIPQGMRGRVLSVAGSPSHTAAGATNGGHAQTQTVLISPGSGNLTYSNPRTGYHTQVVPSSRTNYRNVGMSSRLVRPNSYGTQGSNNKPLRSMADDYDTQTPDSFVTVTKSVTGKLDNGKQQPDNTEGKKFTHTYYSKSSTCGYFTFSCNVVYGSNGRTKICKPNPPTNADGSPCCC